MHIFMHNALPARSNYSTTLAGSNRSAAERGRRVAHPHACPAQPRRAHSNFCELFQSQTATVKIPWALRPTLLTRYGRARKQGSVSTARTQHVAADGSDLTQAAATRRHTMHRPRRLPRSFESKSIHFSNDAPRRVPGPVRANPYSALTRRRESQESILKPDVSKETSETVHTFREILPLACPTPTLPVRNRRMREPCGRGPACKKERRNFSTCRSEQGWKGVCRHLFHTCTASPRMPP